MGTGCALVFLLPLAAVGIRLVMATLAGPRELNEEALFAGWLGLLFCVAGCGGAAAVLASRRNRLEMLTLETLNPHAPWLWRTEWASGRLVHPVRATLYGGWFVAVLANLAAVPGALMLAHMAVVDEKPGLWLGMLLPLGSAVFLARAVLPTLRYRKYGVSSLELATLPAVPGHRLAGTVRIPVRLHAPEGFNTVLSCTRIQRLWDYDGTIIRKDVLWWRERLVRGDAGSGDLPETRVPIYFDLPADAEPYDESDPDRRVLWRLQVSARMPGVDYAASFQVPVFRDAGSGAALLFRPRSESAS